MAVYARLNNEFTEDEKCHNLMSWLILASADKNTRTIENENQCCSLWNDVRTIEPSHEIMAKVYMRRYKTNRMTCAPSDDSDQPGHPFSLIRVFTVRIKKHWILSYPLSACEDSDQTGRMPRLTWVVAGRTYHSVGFVKRRSKWVKRAFLLLATHSSFFAWGNNMQIINCPWFCLLYCHALTIQIIRLYEVLEFQNKFSFYICKSNYSFRSNCWWNMSRDMTKPTMCPVWSGSSLSAWRKLRP